MAASPIWTLVYNGVEKAFADWGIERPAWHQESQTVDTLEFSIVEDADATPTFAFGARLVVKRAGVTWFSGTVSRVPRDATDSEERIGYQVSGPGYELDGTRYQQEAANFDGTHYLRVFSSRINLGILIDWAPTLGENPGPPVSVYAGIKDAISDILDYAGDRGIALAYDAAMPNDVFPAQQARDISCGAAMRRVLEWAPDAVSWWNYASGVPTFHLQRRGSQQAVSFTLGEGALKEVHIVPREDLIPPCVCLCYERVDTLNGTPYLHYEKKVFPADKTGFEPFAVNESIDLKGYSATTVSGQVTARRIEATSLAWWAGTETAAGKLPWLKDARIQHVDISNVATSPSPLPYLNELVSGQWSAWMPIHAAQVTITAKALITSLDDQGNTQRRVEDLACQVIATDAPCNLDGTAKTSTYSMPDTYDEGQKVPNGLEQSLYTALATLHYSGTIVLEEAECDDWAKGLGLTNPGVGLVVNIAGAEQAAWATMRAQVQSCSKDIETGRTTFTVGPPGHLRPADLTALHEMNSYGFRWENPRMRLGSLEGSSHITQPQEAARQQANTGAGGWIEMFVSGLTSQTPQLTVEHKTNATDPTPVSKAVLDPQHLQDSGGHWHNARYYQVGMCIKGRQMATMVNMSPPFDPVTGQPCTWNASTGEWDLPV